MSVSSEDEIRAEYTSDAGDNLRHALMRLTSPQVQELQGEIVRLKEQIDVLRKLEGDTTELQTRLDETSSIISAIEKKFLQLGEELRDPAMIGQRLETTVVPALHNQVRSRGEAVAEALAPVIGPALRRQIRDAKDDIIDALYPIIGQIIGKAIAEALRELTRNIDSRLRQQLNFRDRLNQTLARLRGVSEAELMLRGSLPYSIERVFLVHRETGMLLSHVSSVAAGRAGGMDTISGMLTAIQDFVRDSFSGGEGELEEIAHGGRRILLEGGQRAYVAVVLNGIEPEGYSHLIREVVHNINVQYENELKKFDGDMERLPDFQPTLVPLLTPESSASKGLESGKPLSRPQKRALGMTLAGLLLLIAFLIFACVFTIRLWPVAFPGRIALPTTTSTLVPSSTPTTPPTLTPTPEPSLTPTPVPTSTPTAQPPSPTPAPVALLTGNLNVRAEPSTRSRSLGVVLAGEKVIVKDSQEDWYLISWPADGEPILEGWVWGQNYLVLPAGQIP